MVSGNVLHMKPKWVKKPVILEPELEAIAGELGVFDRLQMAEKMERWVRQLRISARMLAKPNARRRRPPRLTGKQAALN